VWRFWSLISGGQAVGTNRSPPATQPQALLARSPAQHAGRPPLMSSPSRSLFLRASDPLMSALDLPHQMQTQRGSHRSDSCILAAGSGRCA
jgi:hypothetical protein